jgi:hypothetical protein
MYPNSVTAAKAGDQRVINNGFRLRMNDEKTAGNMMRINASKHLSKARPLFKNPQILSEGIGYLKVKTPWQIPKHSETQRLCP